jgi:hypothetical protein
MPEMGCSDGRRTRYINMCELYRGVACNSQSDAALTCHRARDCVGTTFTMWWSHQHPKYLGFDIDDHALKYLYTPQDGSPDSLLCWGRTQNGREGRTLWSPANTAGAVCEKHSLMYSRRQTWVTDGSNRKVLSCAYEDMCSRNMRTGRVDGVVRLPGTAAGSCPACVTRAFANNS